MFPIGLALVVIGVTIIAAPELIGYFVGTLLILL
ncbi:MAG: hypothetical protein QG650_368 [Patescibacteria group bacterium]|nr:hypothetical protein [Patescibacteria group bacterium]